MHVGACSPGVTVLFPQIMERGLATHVVRGGSSGGADGGPGGGGLRSPGRIVSGFAAWLERPGWVLPPELVLGMWVASILRGGNR